MFKRCVFLFFCSLFNVNSHSSATPNYSGIHKNDFPYYVRLEGDKILASKKIDISSLSFSLRRNYDDCITKALSRLDSVCWGQGHLFVELSKIRNITTEEVNGFVSFIESLVFSGQFDSEINNFVCDFLHKNGLVKSDVFKDSANEYNSRYDKVKEKLQNTMANEYRDYVSKQEIEKTVSGEFMVLVARIKKSKTDESETSQSSGGFWNWLMGRSSSTSDSESFQTNPKTCSTSYCASSDKVYEKDVEQRVVVISDFVLQEKGYSQNSLPARVISDYSDVVQRIIKKVKDKIFYNNYEFLYTNDVKNIARDELQAIFDKITLKGEQCSICLEVFTTWQQLGVLKCSHIFHKNCIEQALKQSGKKCPLCYVYADSVDHIETVPWQ